MLLTQLDLFFVFNQNTKNFQRVAAKSSFLTEGKQKKAIGEGKQSPDKLGSARIDFSS